MYTFICYDRCGTCKKAEKWMQEKGVEYVKRPIREEKPSFEELTAWKKASGLPLQKFYNTSGQLYKSMNLKEKRKGMSEEEKKMTITFGKNELEIDSVNSKISGKYKKEKNYSFENYFEEFYTKMKYENSEYNASFINEKLTLNMFQVDDEHVYIEVIGKVDGKIHFLDRVLKIESKGILKNVETDDQEPFTIEIKDDSLLLSGLVIEKEMNGEYKKEKNLSNREIVKKIYYNY